MSEHKLFKMIRRKLEPQHISIEVGKNGDSAVLTQHYRAWADETFAHITLLRGGGVAVKYEQTGEKKLHTPSTPYQVVVDNLLAHADPQAWTNGPRTAIKTRQEMARAAIEAAQGAIDRLHNATVEDLVVGLLNLEDWRRELALAVQTRESIEEAGGTGGAEWRNWDRTAEISGARVRAVEIVFRALGVILNTERDGE